jgi:hypothetical protein
MDRQGRIVGTTTESGQQRDVLLSAVARDGEYPLAREALLQLPPAPSSFAESVLKMTLDRPTSRKFPSRVCPDAIDVTDDGSLLYGRRSRATRNEA